MVKVNRVQPREVGKQAGEEAAQRQQFQQWLGTAEGIAYFEMLKERFKVQIKVPRPQS